MNKNKFTKFLLLSGTLLSLNSFANDYIVCKSTLNGMLKCEDGLYKPTGETAEAIAKPESKPNFKNFVLDEATLKSMIPSESGPKVRNRISSLLKEVGSGPNLNSEAILGKLLVSQTISPKRAEDLIKELKKNPDIGKLQPKALLEAISEAKVLI